MSKQQSLGKKALLIDHLKKGRIGTAEELAGQIGVARRTFFRYIEELRDHGADIQFRKESNTYTLENDFDFIESYVKMIL